MTYPRPPPYPSATQPAPLVPALYSLPLRQHTDTQLLDFDTCITPEMLDGGATYTKKAVTLKYDTHDLQGTLYLLPQEDYLELHSRYFDILPSLLDKLESSITEAWALIHPIQGITWAGVTQLPSESYILNTYGLVRGETEPHFVAVTNDQAMFEAAKFLGKCDISGKLDSHDPSAEFIVALPSHKPFDGVRKEEPYKVTRTSYYKSDPLVDYPPKAVRPMILHIAKKINEQARDPKTNTTHARPQRFKVKQEFPEVMNIHGFLNPEHAFYKHRGNEWLLRRDIWCILSYPPNMPEEIAIKSGHAEMPTAYYQVLFPDLQQRARVGPTEYSIPKALDVQWFEG